MLRWIVSMTQAKVKKTKARAKKRVASLKVRRSAISNNLRLGRNILRMV